MAKTFLNRIKHAWNALRDIDFRNDHRDKGSGSSRRPDRIRLTNSNERSIIASIYNRISTDVASISINHVRLDENDRYIETIKSGLNEALTVEANVDQTGRALIHDAVLSMFDEGCVAIVPVDTTINPSLSGGYDINTLRTARILEWFPKHVRVRLYDERTGEKEDITLEKKYVAIIENPFYAVMNEYNSTLQRLIRKLNLLDGIDEQSGSGKLDLIIQLPYVIKTAARKAQADLRRSEIETQLADSKYGIAYTDGTEKVTQLNRPVENNLMNQIIYLTSELYGQLGITQSVLDGTADEKTMINYYNRSVEPILAAIVLETKRKFLTKTARTQNQSIMYFRDVFKLVPVADLAESADKFTRNEILTSNEFRAIIGYRPVKSQAAEELRNKNIPLPDENVQNKPKGEKQNEKQKI